MWYLIYFLRRLFNKIGLPKPIIKRKVLSLRYSLLFSKAFLFSFILIIFFTSGFLYNHYFASTEKTKKSNNELTKEYFSKIFIIAIFFMLNFFINQLHLSAYKMQDMVINNYLPNDNYFRVFLLLILILLMGFLTMNKFLPSSLKLGTKFYEGNKDYITLILIILNAFYVFSNILLDPSRYSYLFFGIVSTTGLILHKKVVNIWIIYALLSLFMINNFNFLINVRISKGWSGLHSFIHAFQIAMCLFGLIKEENYQFFGEK